MAGFPHAVLPCPDAGLPSLHDQQKESTQLLQKRHCLAGTGSWQPGTH